jgi:uncharacterized alkaline shock family protein YloU
MKGLGRFLNVLATLLLLVIGGGLLAASFGLLDISSLLFGREFLTGVIGGAMLLLGLIVIFVAVQSVRPEQAISIRNPEGEVRITFSAIEELLRKGSRHIDGVKELKPKVVGGKRGLEFLNRVSVEADVSIPQVTARIQEMVKSQVKGVLGIEEVGPIRIYVNRIVTEEVDKEEGNKGKDVQF